MFKFMCTNCQYTLEADAPPEKCPSCGKTCSFIDASCYTPDCGCEKGLNTSIYDSHKSEK